MDFAIDTFNEIKLKTFLLHLLVLLTNSVMMFTFIACCREMENILIQYRCAFFLNEPLNSYTYRFQKADLLLAKTIFENDFGNVFLRTDYIYCTHTSTWHVFTACSPRDRCRFLVLHISLRESHLINEKLACEITNVIQSVNTINSDFYFKLR